MDNLFRYITHDGSAVLSVIDSTEMVRFMEQHHHTSATASAALGRALTGASMMGYELKDEDTSLTLLIKGDGPIGTITVVSDWTGNVRGYCDNPYADLPEKSRGKLDVGGLVGHNGTLYVIKDLGMNAPYRGQIELQSGEIAEDLTAYYAISEQQPTVCALGVLVDTDLTIKHAGGFLLHLLPGADENCIDVIEKNIASLPGITAMLSAGESQEEIANQVFAGLDPDFLDSAEVGFKCNCSRERMESILLSVGKEDLLSLAEDQDETETICHFCNSTYVFSKDDILKLAERAGNKTSAEKV